MILTAHQPVYLPWIGLFHKIALADSFCYFDNVQFQIKDFNGRNKIKTAQGPAWLTIPVKSKDYREKKIHEIQIDNSQNWRAKHFKSIYLNYKKAPFFENYADFFEEVYVKKEWEYLSELNEHMLKWFLSQLGIRVNYSKASEQNFEGRKSDLVLDMCKKLKANLYIFGALGKDYANKESFEKSGIKLYFQDYKHPVYSQMHGKFEPYLSIIDLLFNCGPDSRQIIMQQNMTKSELSKTYA